MTTSETRPIGWSWRNDIRSLTGIPRAGIERTLGRMPAEVQRLRETRTRWAAWTANIPLPNGGVAMHYILERQSVAEGAPGALVYQDLNDFLAVCTALGNASGRADGLPHETPALSPAEERVVRRRLIRQTLTASRAHSVTPITTAWRNGGPVRSDILAMIADMGLRVAVETHRLTHTERDRLGFRALQVQVYSVSRTGITPSGSQRDLRVVMPDEEDLHGFIRSSHRMHQQRHAMGEHSRVADVSRAAPPATPEARRGTALENAWATLEARAAASPPGGASRDYAGSATGRISSRDPQMQQLRRLPRPEPTPTPKPPKRPRGRVLDFDE